MNYRVGKQKKTLREINITGVLIVSHNTVPGVCYIQDPETGSKLEIKLNYTYGNEDVHHLHLSSHKHICGRNNHTQNIQPPFSLPVWGDIIRPFLI